MLRMLNIPLLLVFLVSSSAIGAGVEPAPDPVKAIRSAAKDFLRLTAKQGYATQLAISGGMANSVSHKIVDQAVDEAYAGLVRGPLMHMPEQQIFRTVDKGALFDGDIWRKLQSTADGKKLDRHFAFPERNLSEAAKKPQKVEWLESEDKVASDDRKKPAGKTAVAEREENRLYNKLRVTLSDKTALQYFIEVQNSGCLSGG